MQQQEDIWEGVLIGDREDKEHKILLYQIDGFYIEAFYHKEHNVIKSYGPFCSVDLLVPYLDRIEIKF